MRSARSNLIRSRALAALAVLGTVTLGGCTQSVASGFEVDPTSVSCYVQSDSGFSVLQIPLRAIESLGQDPKVVWLELNNAQGIELAGIEVIRLPSPYDALNPVDSSDAERLGSLVDDQSLWHQVNRGDTATMVVLLSLADSDNPGSIESLDLLWGGGEPIYRQPLTVSVEISEVCTISEKSNTSTGD